MKTHPCWRAGIFRIPRGQIGVATRAVWAVITLVFALVLLSSAVLPVEVAAGWSSRCQLQASHRGRCPLCGMTRAFLAISRGRLGQASAANAGGLPLYAAMLGDQAAFAAAALYRRRRRCRVPEKLHADS